MAWKRRKGHLYYYRNERVGTRVVSHYGGSGEQGLLHMSLDHHIRDARARVAAQRADDRQHDRTITTALQHVRGLVADVLTRAGYHQHKRTWRKQRMALSSDEYAVMQRCQKPNASKDDITALRQLFATYPERFHSITNLLEHAEERIIEWASDTPFLRETLRAGLVRVQLDLGYDNAPALERLLIDAVCLTWLRLALLEQQHTRALSGAHSLEVGRYWDQRLSSAHGRYLRAVEALARVRRLAVPALVQNIAAHQTVTIGG